MDDLNRLIYVSRSTKLAQDHNHIQAVNEQIIYEAHSFNKINNITGILCYGNECYFQLIEGPKTSIDLLYLKIKKDPRHKDIKLIFNGPTTSRKFGGWQMKLIEDVNITMPLVRMHRHKDFNPFEFSENLCNDLIDFLSQKCADSKC